MTSRVATTLTGFVSRLAYRNEEERRYHAQLLRELRALLAVARTADRVVLDLMAVAHQLRGMATRETDTNGQARAVENCVNVIEDRLDRLSRASSLRGERGAKARRAR